MLLKELGIRQQALDKMKKRGITTAEDMLLFYPIRYLDYTNGFPISMAKSVDGSRATFTGYAKMPRVIKNKHTMCRFDDDSGSISVIWFNQPWMVKKIGTGVRYCFGGIVKWDAEYNSATIFSPDFFEKANDKVTGRIIPVYPSIKGVSDDYIRLMIRTAFDYVYAVPDPIGTSSRKALNVPCMARSLLMTHYPKSMEEVEMAKRRHIVDLLMPFAKELELKKLDAKCESAVQIKTASILNGLLTKLPYNLTNDQMRTLKSIVEKMREGLRIDALVQGDVGCGKTIVAVLLSAVMYQNHYQTVVMAPTAVLATQHYEEFTHVLSDTGAIVVNLQGGMKAKDRRETLKKIEEGMADIIIGTHAVFSKDVIFHNLGLTIIDEEHRFGVKQREVLREKASLGVHTVSMSATPIPRSVAVAVYGESTIIYNIRSMPNGRKPVKTIIYSDEEKVYKSMLSQIQKGHQCYVICPLIESTETMEGIDSVESTYKKMTEWFAPYHISVAAIAGNMKDTEIEDALNAFAKDDIKILISTTIVEVGVNVPNATVILIKNAERFGLAQLHQLRGRVGRSSLQSYCVLLSDKTDNDRLKIMAQTNDGFVIAQKDMELRGTGQILGFKQSGSDEQLDLVLSNQGLYHEIQNETKRLLSLASGDKKNKRK